MSLTLIFLITVAAAFVGVAALAAAMLGWMFDGFEMGLFPVVARPALHDLLQGTTNLVGNDLESLVARFDADHDDFGSILAKALANGPPWPTMPKITSFLPSLS